MADNLGAVFNVLKMENRQDMISDKANKSLKNMQNKQLEMLHELDRVCKKLNIRYYLSSGTCLGALRHGGFIPWDDDVDVYMYWKDAEKLAQNQNMLEHNYFVQSRHTDPNVKESLYRLRDSSTTMILENDKDLNINHGIFIDIYILYPYPDNPFKAHILILKSFLYRVLIARQGPENHGLIAKKAGDIFYKLFPDWLVERTINQIENEYKYNGGKRYFATYFGRDVSLAKSIIYPKKWFSKPRMLQFEDLLVACPGETEKYCELQYGRSFMELPPIEKREPHHDYIYASTTVPYKEYLDKINKQGKGDTE